MTTRSPHSSAVDQTSTDLAVASASAAETSCLLRRTANCLSFLSSRSRTPRTYPRLPLPSKERLEASLTETSLGVENLSRSGLEAAKEKGKTILYLAYGSNLCNETFRGRRGIKPLSRVNVLVPSLLLVFDLPGIPYQEPCFANSALRDPEAGKEGKEDYHKDRWHKGMVGCVYEVTPSDYAHIIATEGGGSEYQDILVPCYVLPSDIETVPGPPSSAPFMAHTLFAPVTSKTRVARPDPSYAQPSARYLKLITDGAAELDLPREYQNYLNDIRPYTITTKRQEMGQKLIVVVWWPILMVLFAIIKRLQDDKGRSPKWVGTLMGWIFLGLWMSYDGVLKTVFGDGERTEGEDDDDSTIQKNKKRGVEGMECPWRGHDVEKQALV
ncbi:hypothetical protein K504DRAFT_466800 [Pleomassaria siparia CBS 279.74]|uniref:gamma-glutamylcyclotransferase n=1 Tax=Pleomassaria siparia CBS 279.74 TaxID=1314801 RepID=A0A6G1KC87_9PLEO|nr:hypothetical protein K504DRAFT_466800 [Pleomassaria siparia CBS 279.74]